jgi:hypothetical protein
MEIYLAKTLDKMKMYGTTYDLSMEPDDRVETYFFDLQENEWLLDNLVDSINAYCGTLLDNGDYDFIPSDECASLISVLEKVDLKIVPEKSRLLVEKMMEFAERAIQYNTGMAIEL